MASANTLFTKIRISPNPPVFDLPILVALGLLPSRLADVYPTEWDQGVWSAIDRQIEVAVKLRLLDAAPERPLYDGLALRRA
jgi:hypothetical protein